MARREQFTVGELLWNGVREGAVTVLARDGDGKIMFAKGATLPTGAGYAVGCLFINTSTGLLSVNMGTTTSCNFRGTFGASLSPSISPSVSPSVSPSS